MRIENHSHNGLTGRELVAYWYRVAKFQRRMMSMDRYRMPFRRGRLRLAKEALQKAKDARALVTSLP